MVHCMDSPLITLNKYVFGKEETLDIKLIIRSITLNTQ